MQEISILNLTIIATEEIRAKTAVTYDGKTAKNGDKVFGVAVTTASKGDSLNVSVKGTSTILAGGSFSPGDDLTTDAEGRAIKATDASYVFANALHKGVIHNTTEVLLK